MYNARKPASADLPSTGALLRSTAIAAVSAGILLVTVVLPAEYAIDPTGAGRILGLTTMGEIKSQLAAEAAQDRAEPVATAEQVKANTPIVVTTERAETVETVAPASAVEATDDAPPAPAWSDEISFTLTPGEGIEFKLVMENGSQAEFFWSSEGGPVNFDLHGDGSGQSISYEKGRSIERAEGVLTAAFTGNHGWFWRNRNDAPVTLTLRVRGEYSELKQTA